MTHNTTNLVEVFRLYAAASVANFAVGLGLGQHEELVDNDVVSVNATLGEFLH